MATLTLMRPEEAGNRNETLTVALNNNLPDCIGNNSSKSFELTAGAHKLYLRAGASAGKTYAFTIKEGQQKTLVISTDAEAPHHSPFGSGWLLLDFVVNGTMLLYYFVTGRSRQLKVEEITW